MNKYNQHVGRNRGSELVTKLNHLVVHEPSEDHRTILEIQKIIECNYKIERYAAFYAEQANLPLHQLNSLLKTYLGKTIAALLQDRIQRAAEYLLISSTLSCKQISFELNISYPPYFCRCFKKKTGLSPAEFRKKYQALPDLRTECFNG